MLTDYFEFTSHLGRAYAALAREWSEGHNPAALRAKADDNFVGVELFEIERFDPARAYLHLMDPMQIALGILAGQLNNNAEAIIPTTELATTL
jgi:hypothetical protein